MKPSVDSQIRGVNDPLPKAKLSDPNLTGRKGRVGDLRGGGMAQKGTNLEEIWEILGGKWSIFVTNLSHHAFGGAESPPPPGAPVWSTTGHDDGWRRRGVGGEGGEEGAGSG